MSRKRSEIAKDIVAAGGVVFDDISNKDVTLVQADPTSSSSKSKKANKLGASVISEEQLMSLMGK
jgi:DNA ligase (NAD+)